MKYIITSIFITLFLLTTATALVAPSNTGKVYVDLNEKHQYKEAIEYITESNIASGFSDNTFRPDKTITRAEFIKIVFNATVEASTQEACITSGFSDVDAQHKLLQYICKAKSMNIVSGYPDNSFKPDNEINVVEASKILVNSFKTPLNAAGSTEWYEPYINSLSEKNALPTTIDDQDHKLTRGEMAEIIHRLKAGITERPSKDFSSIQNANRAVLYFDPIQCGGNPWDEAVNVSSTSEAEIIKQYYTDMGIEIYHAMVAEKPDTNVCQACSCPRGDKVVVKVAPEDKARLLGLGFYE